MKLLMVILTCDGCRQLFEVARFAEDNPQSHSDMLSQLSQENGWACSEDDNSHYCPECFVLFEKMASFAEETN